MRLLLLVLAALSGIIAAPLPQSLVKAPGDLIEGSEVGIPSFSQTVLLAGNEDQPEARPQSPLWTYHAGGEFPRIHCSLFEIKCEEVFRTYPVRSLFIDWLVSGKIQGEYQPYTGPSHELTPTEQT